MAPSANTDNGSRKVLPTLPRPDGPNTRETELQEAQQQREKVDNNYCGVLESSFSWLYFIWKEGCIATFQRLPDITCLYFRG